MTEDQMVERWAPLIEPMGSCSCCVYQNQCEELKRRSDGRIRFRCPLQIEVNVEYSDENREEGWKKENGEWIWEKINKSAEDKKENGNSCGWRDRYILSH